MNNAKQQGLALLMMVFVLVLVAVGYAVLTLDGTDLKQVRDRRTAAALAEAKDALIGSVINNDVTVSPYLINPDLKLSPVIPEGSESEDSGGIDESLIGKVPWRSLGTSLVKDGWGECLWYVVSGRFKNGPKTNDVLNWDTQGQIDVINGNGDSIVSNLAALVVSSGAPLAGQNRLPIAGLPRCGGNYDVKNYLDTFSVLNAAGGNVNYFSGSTNNREAPNINNKRFVLANNDYYNDRFVFVTVDDIFRPILRRSSFRDQISNLLNNAHVDAVIVSGAKGTDNIDCLAMPNQEFCRNWRDMLLLKEPPPGATIIDGGAAALCSRVIIFGGKRTGAQSRITNPEKSSPENYLEGANIDAFNDGASSFDGVSNFSPVSPSLDVMRCVL